MCLSPSTIEHHTTEECSVIPVDMTSGSGENGRRNRIRIVLNGKLFPVSAGQHCVSESLRNIRVYSDDEVDCNDDGRSLDGPIRRLIVPERADPVHQDSSKKPTESPGTGKHEVPPPKVDRVPAVKESDRKDVDERKTKTACSSSEHQDLRLNSTNIDDRSRSSQRHRQSADRWMGQTSSRKERRGHGYSGSYEHGRPGFISAEKRRSRNERSHANFVAADRGASSHYKTAAERHTGTSSRHETARSGHRNQVSGSRSRSTKSRSPLGHSRAAETGSSCSRSRTKDHGATRTELDERQQRWSKPDDTSVSGRRSDRHASSRTRPEVESRCWRQDRVTEPYDVVPPIVPRSLHRTNRHAERSD